jgi:drug/metabolite transporter (DMT)-like permease
MAGAGVSGAAPLRRPPARDLVWLGVAVAFISSSAPIIAAAAAPALAIAFWRCFLGSAVTSPWVLLRRREELRRIGRREWGLVALAGVFLGLHFATWIPSVRLTTVASSTALVATQPVWAALIAARRGARLPRSAWSGIVIALVGVVLLTGIDVSVDPQHLVGDLLALLGAVLAAAYVSVAESARRTVSTSVLTTGLYATAAVLLLGLCLVAREPLAGYSVQTWGLILLLTAGAQLLGHSLINKVLATTSATVVSLAILLEVPGAVLIAAVALHQWPPVAIWPAVALMAAGIVVVIRAGSRSTVTESPPV